MFFDTEGKFRTATFMKTVGGNGKIAGEVTIDGEYALDIIRMNDDLSIAVQDNKGRSRADRPEIIVASEIIYPVYVQPLCRNS